MGTVHMQCCRSRQQYHSYYKLLADIIDMLDSQMTQCNSSCLCIVNVYSHGLLHLLKLVFNAYESKE